MVSIQETGQGLIVSLKVKPNSPKLRLAGNQDDITLEVTGPAQEGKANQEILRELPKLLRCEVKILRGGSQKRKLLLLSGISREEFTAVLES